MKRTLIFVLIVFWIAAGCAHGEEIARRALEDADVSGLMDFAGEYGAAEDVKGILEASLQSGDGLSRTLIPWLERQAVQPFREAAQALGRLLPLMLLMAMLRCTTPASRGGAGAAMFALRLSMLLALMEIVSKSLQEAQKCLEAAERFADRIAPALAALLSAAGMDGSAALVSPAAALIGDLSAGLFAKWGLPLCRISLCSAAAGNLSRDLNLNRATRLIRRSVNWGAGLAIALFTALLAIQGGVSEGLDGVAMRTAKYAVDSASSVIGSGVSDAWDSYVSGVQIAKNALGVSGIAAMLAANLPPMLRCLICYGMLHLVAAILDVFGDGEGASAAEQMAGICQMALSLCTSATAIATILLGASMAAGRNLLG